MVASGAVSLPYDVNLGVVWTYRSDLPFSATAGRDLNFNGRNSSRFPTPLPRPMTTFLSAATGTSSTRKRSTRCRRTSGESSLPDRRARRRWHGDSRVGRFSDENQVEATGRPRAGPSLRPAEATRSRRLLPSWGGSFEEAAARPSSRGRSKLKFLSSGAVSLPYDVNLGVVWTYRSDLPFSATAGRDLNFNGPQRSLHHVPQDVVGQHTQEDVRRTGARHHLQVRNQGNRDLDLGAVNASKRAQFDLDPVPESQIESTKLFVVSSSSKSKTSSTCASARPSTLPAPGSKL